jgi:hypothetical protein
LIYADLSVHDADTPPNVPIVPPEQDLLDALRYYSELLGGPFPASLGRGAGDELSPILNKKFHIEEGQKPNAEQKKELVEVGLKLALGETFVMELSPEADAHYAGKGVSLSAADTPIFWYRPKNSKKYRVVYADLSVRDADAPPSVPDAQPVQGRSGQK